MTVGLDVLQGSHDLRRTFVDTLRYPSDSLVLLAGVPGAGKSTLVERLYGTPPGLPADVRVLDAEHTRERWEAQLRAVPYVWWRPVLHAAHYAAALSTIASGGPLIMADCATRPWVRQLVGSAAERRGLRVHLILLDVTAEEALAGQRARGREITAASFTRHWQRWRDVLGDVAIDPARMIRGAESAVLLDRAGVDHLREIGFT